MPRKSPSPAENATKATKPSAKPTPKKPAAKKAVAPKKTPQPKPEPAKRGGWRAAPVEPEQDLSPSAQRFVDEYLIDLNATQAYLRANPGVSLSTASAEGCRLTGNPKVAALIAQRKHERAERVGVDAHRVLKEVARLALFDPRKLFDADGVPLPIHQLDDDTAAALAGLDVQEVRLGTGEGAERAVVKKYKLADKGANLDRLMKHLGLFERDNAQKVDPIAQLLAGMGRSSVPVVKEPGHE
ncbi:hypothetical protein GCM10007320_08770 [Pseudorhodoferax aquiterrae]|uniref:Terminase small subunit n=1 Tax=Pseudorhodoferax aquiterrae TaxID=747304 RepID=A0ABQ3FXW1_9BURK|nr:terminase small subunit [Pseudorhodoferax aquiterrae]GHC72712.1 hypothetical protein GCM10007320_08770 [Pseudorhodoferax aquiterrae]